MLLGRICFKLQQYVNSKPNLQCACNKQTLFRGINLNLSAVHPIKIPGPNWRFLCPNDHFVILLTNREVSAVARAQEAPP